ncbi:hypothetical protein GW17_00033311 [Ensete ventricosum]|nr:hypothetical protein GW17_00033311 [Ensete ventricosum]
MTNQDNQDLTFANPAASGILAVSLPVFFRQSLSVFPTSFPIPSANLLANFGEIPLHRLNPTDAQIDHGPSSGSNFIAPVIVRAAARGQRARDGAHPWSGRKGSARQWPCRKGNARMRPARRGVTSTEVPHASSAPARP